MAEPSLRSRVVEARTYLRPLNKEGTLMETPTQAVDRMIRHQKWLWERALGRDLADVETAELAELRGLIADRKICLSGRTRWLGGTEVARKREASMFNCAFLETRTVHDVVDMLWLLLQGCGVGFRMVPGALNGFSKKMDIEIISSTNGPSYRGPQHNTETWDSKTREWTIKIGDSSEAWAKSIGKILAGKYPADRLIISFENVRGGGERLSGYGWISSGDAQISRAYLAIAKIMSERAGQLLTRVDILDIQNWLGMILSSRRSAQIAMMGYEEPEWKDFALAKKDHGTNGKYHRGMSNNSLMFYSRPTKYKLTGVFKMIAESGGSEPGLINAQAALRRAPWFRGVNPCGEILLGDRSFCNLTETVLFRFNGDEGGLHRAHYLAARANYRQTCVDLRDGVLQEGWHQLNQFLRLCGVGVTGVVAWENWREAEAWQMLKMWATKGAHSMADELNMPRAKAVTTVKPSGTQSKTCGIVEQECPEGVHRPLGKYIFNNIRFSEHDPLLSKLEAANYFSFPDPYDKTGVVVRIPVSYSGIHFHATPTLDGPIHLDNEPAIEQLDRYKLLMDNYVDHNCSITVQYQPNEVPDIIDWLLANWDDYVGVAFLPRQNPLLSAKEQGHLYLPQEVVTQATYEAYVSSLLPVNLDGTASLEEIDVGKECINGTCPIR